MWLPLLILIAVGVGFGIAVEVKRRREMRPIASRYCAGIRWRRYCPKAAPDEIRRFLVLFVDSFAFPRKYRNRLRPTDKVMDLYRVLNPPDCTLGDAMELETLASELERTYKLDLAECWHEDITLGDLFCRAMGITRRCS
ncbi:MAG TPA: hypothetical protein PK458_12265 [Phycisphaerae bacterium]|nr:hypothetical protein [Phycisphaerae bacterium]